MQVESCHPKPKFMRKEYAMLISVGFYRQKASLEGLCTVLKEKICAQDALINHFDIVEFHKLSMIFQLIPLQTP
jgi:hypothetical protein